MTNNRATPLTDKEIAMHLTIEFLRAKEKVLNLGAVQKCYEEFHKTVSNTKPE